MIIIQMSGRLVKKNSKLLKTDFYELTSLRRFLKQFLCLYFEILYKLCSYFLTYFFTFLTTVPLPPTRDDV